MAKKYLIVLLALIILGGIVGTFLIRLSSEKPTYSASVSVASDRVQVVIQSVGGNQDRRIAVILLPREKIRDSRGSEITGGGWTITSSDPPDLDFPETARDPVSSGMEAGAWCFHILKHTFCVTGHRMSVDGMSYVTSPELPALNIDLRPSAATEK